MSSSDARVRVVVADDHPFFRDGGYLSKDARRAEIVEAVLDVARGKTVLPPGVAAGLAGEIRLRAQSVGGRR